MNKTLIVGDPHLQVQRLEDGRLFLDRILKLAQVEQCSRIVLLGDLFHTFAVIRSEVLALWNDFFIQCQGMSRVISLVGNHDYASQSGGNHALEVFEEVARIVAEPQVVDGVHYFPFMRDNRAFEKLAKELPAESILVCHQSFLGARFSSGFADPHGADPGCVGHLRSVISGHIHSEQRIGNIWYPGTPYQMNFGEAGEEKHVFITDLGSEGYSISRRHDLGLPKFRMVQAGRVEDLRLPEPDLTTSYKFVAKGTPGEIAAFWSDPKVKDFRGKVRRVVDALIPERGEVVLPGSSGKTKREKLDEFIASKKWRTPGDRLAASARDLLFERDLVS